MFGIFGGASGTGGVVADTGTHGRLDTANTELTQIDTDLNAGLGTDGSGSTPSSGTGVRGWLHSIYDKLNGTINVAVVSGGSSSTVSQGTAAVITAPWPVELSDGTQAVGTSAHPVRTDPTGTTTQPVSATSLPLPTGAATAAAQTTAQTSLSTIATNIPPQGQALAASSTPVVLTAAQITALTPPAQPTDFPSTAANTKLDTLNTSLTTLGTDLTGGTQKTKLTDGTNTVGVTVDASGTNALNVVELTDDVTITTTGASDTVINTENFRSGSVHLVSAGTSISFIVQVSNDNTNWIQIPTLSPSLASPVPSLTALTVASQWYEFRTPLKYCRIHVTTQTGAAPNLVAHFKTQELSLANVASAPVVAAQSGSWTVAQGAASALPWPVWSGGWSFLHQSALTAGVTVKSGAGVFHGITVNNAGSGSTVTVYDGTSTAGTIIAVLQLNTTEIVMRYDCAFATGLFIVVASGTSPDMTITYR